MKKKESRRSACSISGNLFQFISAVRFVPVYFTMNAVRHVANDPDSVYIAYFGKYRTAAMMQLNPPKDIMDSATWEKMTSR